MDNANRPAMTQSAKNFDSLPNTARVDIQVLKVLTGKSRATIYRWIDLGILPRPIKTIGTQNAWTAGQIRAALNIEQK